MKNVSIQFFLILLFLSCEQIEVQDWTANQGTIETAVFDNDPGTFISYPLDFAQGKAKFKILSLGSIVLETSLSELWLASPLWVEIFDEDGTLLLEEHHNYIGPDFQEMTFDINYQGFIIIDICHAPWVPANLVKIHSIKSKYNVKRD